SLCFFFQAEDGIRDFHVTGVQTCALPILGRHRLHGGEQHQYQNGQTVVRASAGHRKPPYAYRLFLAQSPCAVDLFRAQGSNRSSSLCMVNAAHFNDSRAMRKAAFMTSSIEDFFSYSGM